ncbi:MAG: preprotein translocase subunit YajC [Phycisphaerales bacterium]|nr:preprotein translocase subunit YajC [Planctomycetota bacterium]MCH8509568.1 preprotein translocase subunit YajC [Phycisphaerales bacterium]
MIQINAATIASWPTLALQDGQVQGVLGAEGGGAGPDQGGAPGAQGVQGQPGGLGWFFPLLMLMIAFLFISTIMGGRKERKRREAMLGALKKRDRVQTAGGVIGTIIEIKDNECLLESDRASNTRLWIARSSVSTVLRSANAPAAENAEHDTEKTQEPASA